MNIVVIGPLGQIGWELTRALSQDPADDVVALDRQSLDLTDDRAIRSTIRNINPDVIINAAGYTAVDQAESDRDIAFSINAAAPAIIAEEAARASAVFISYSTDYVFDGAADQPYRPDAEPNPVNVYGESKLAGELGVLAAGAESLILRTSWVYSTRRNNFLLTMLNLASTRDELSIVNDQFGCPSWSRSIALGTIAIIRRAVTATDRGATLNGAGGIHHLACSGITSWFGLAEHIFRNARLDRTPRLLPISTEQYGAPADRPRYSALDCTSTQHAFGVELGPWESAITEALADEHAAERAARPNALREDER